MTSSLRFQGLFRVADTRSRFSMNNLRGDDLQGIVKDLPEGSVEVYQMNDVFGTGNAIPTHIFVPDDSHDTVVLGRLLELKHRYDGQLRIEYESTNHYTQEDVFQRVPLETGEA